MKHLRQYIRKILLTEGMKTVSDLPEDAYVMIHDNNERFSVKIDSPSWPEYAFIELSNHPFTCSGAWEVIDAKAPQGWGPLLYDVAMEYVGNEGIMCDRSSVSADAANIWDFYLKSRADVKAVQLDYDKKPFVTPQDKSDDCSAYTFMRHSFNTDGDSITTDNFEESFLEHWSTKKYIKVGGSPIIDQLNSMNILEYI